ncbi:tetratricopeptide repeat protein [Bacillus safensis]
MNLGNTYQRLGKYEAALNYLDDTLSARCLIGHGTLACWY